MPDTEQQQQEAEALELACLKRQRWRQQQQQEEEDERPAQLLQARELGGLDAALEKLEQLEQLEQVDPLELLQSKLAGAGSSASGATLGREIASRVTAATPAAPPPQVTVPLSFLVAAICLIGLAVVPVGVLNVSSCVPAPLLHTALHSHMSSAHCRRPLHLLLSSLLSLWRQPCSGRPAATERRRCRRPTTVPWQKRHR